MNDKETKQEAELMQVKEFFGYASIVDLRNDWMRMSDVERQYIKEAVWQATHASQN